MDDVTLKKAEQFRSMHKAGDPVILFNCWDAVSAKLSAETFPVVATSSGAVAKAQGYEDGQKIPLDFVYAILERIAGAVDCPVTVDFEAGYSDDPQTVAGNVKKLMELGVVGINLEDSIVDGKRDFSSPDYLARKIEAVRKMADDAGIPLFINARTDAFLLKVGEPDLCFSQTLERTKIYADAGASGIFVPFMKDLDQVTELVKSTSLPVNVLSAPNVPTVAEYAKAGVSRVSNGGLAIFLLEDVFKLSAKAFHDKNEFLSAVDAVAT